MEPIIFEPLAGMAITQAAETALTMARSENCAVMFNFNGIEIVAPPSNKITRDILAESYLRQSEKRAEDWRNSPEGIAYAEESRLRLAQAQLDAKNCMAALPGIIGLEELQVPAIIGWLVSLTETCQHSGIDWKAATGVGGEPLEWPALLLISAGYREDDLVGEPAESFNTRERMGRYIIGQAISAFRRGMPPHPITLKFAQEYFAMAE